MTNNILIGNGFNIEFGKMDYSNTGIINRLFSNLDNKDYSDVFAQKITSSELKSVMNGLHSEFIELLLGKYDLYCQSYDEKITLQRIKEQYSIHLSKTDIGMEDYFFILKLYHKRYNDPEEMVQSTYDGLCWLFFDAIYNDEKIQKIHELIEPSKKEKLNYFLNQFDNIFTVNYDLNIKAISKKTVYYIHGDFETLLDQYDTETLIGRMYHEFCIPNIMVEKMNHIYCNGIMGFIGSYKERIMDILDNGQFGIEKIIQKYNSGVSSEDEKTLEKMRISENPKQRFAYAIIKTKKKYPYLSFHQYPKNIFQSISGDISIVGLSPNNDDHIWNILQNNTKLEKISYYFKTSQDKESIDHLYSRMKINCSPVDELWKTVFR